jgi:hypothetical protein
MHVSRASRIWQPTNTESIDFRDLDLVLCILGFNLGAKMRTSYHLSHNLWRDGEVFVKVRMRKV